MLSTCQTNFTSTSFNQARVSVRLQRGFLLCLPTSLTCVVVTAIRYSYYIVGRPLNCHSTEFSIILGSSYPFLLAYCSLTQRRTTPTPHMFDDCDCDDALCRKPKIISSYCHNAFLYYIHLAVATQFRCWGGSIKLVHFRTTPSMTLLYS